MKPNPETPATTSHPPEDEETRIHRIHRINREEAAEEDVVVKEELTTNNQIEVDRVCSTLFPQMEVNKSGFQDNQVRV